MGSDDGSGEALRDTTVPLTRDQHSKVQAAARASKAATKAAAPAKPKKPLSQAERLAAIGRAVKKAKSKERFDVATMNPDDMDHDDLRDVHQSLHIGKTYSESVEQIDELKKETLQSYLDKRPAPKIKDIARPETVGKPELRQKDIERANLTRIGRARAKRKIANKTPKPPSKPTEVDYGYGQGRYMGDSVEIGEYIDDLFQQEILGNVYKNNEILSIEEETCCPGEQLGEANGTNAQSVIDATPTLDATSKKKKSQVVPPRSRDAALDGLPVVTTGAYVREAAKPLKSFMKTPRQVPAPAGGHPVPPGYERVKSWGGAYELRKIKEKPATVKEAVEYHIENQVSFTDNIFRPGSEMFFEMISEAKKLYNEGKYTPADKFELDMLNSDIGEIVEFEGEQVVLDYPIEEGLEECWKGYVQKGLKKKGNRMVPNCVPVNEEDKTDGKGIGKPWREGGGGAVYVRTGDGGVKKVRFSQSGMKKKFMDPAATRSFVARHHCLTNKDKTSASYWACRYPRFFSNSGKTWW